MEQVKHAFDVNIFWLAVHVSGGYTPHGKAGFWAHYHHWQPDRLHPVPLKGIYSATTSAVMRLTDAVRLEVAPLGVQEVAISCSSPIDSLWDNWLAVLEAAMSKLLVGSVPADVCAGNLAQTALQQHMPRGVSRWMHGGCVQRHQRSGCKANIACS
eukprot:GHRR01025052.1.p1 GENE.GHRR01025052.1~~GHRR01025052.1.p1  ORF type:complete len:156 (+),score=61.79 GHRR01025052.1:298-765(+)